MDFVSKPDEWLVAMYPFKVFYSLVLSSSSTYRTTEVISVHECNKSPICARVGQLLECGFSSDKGFSHPLTELPA